MFTRIRIAVMHRLVYRGWLKGVELGEGHAVVGVQNDGGWFGHRPPEIRLVLSCTMRKTPKATVGRLTHYSFTLSPDSLPRIAEEINKARAAHYIWKHG